MIFGLRDALSRGLRPVGRPSRFTHEQMLIDHLRRQREEREVRQDWERRLK